MSFARLARAARGLLRAACGVLALALSACVRWSDAPAPARDVRQDTPLLEAPPAKGFPLEWNPGQVLLQGYLGASYLSEFEVSPDGSESIELDEDEYEVLPLVGGGAQLKLAGERLAFGIEGFLALSGRSDLEAFASSGGVTVAVFDVSLLVWEVYGGPFVSLFAGDRLRLYASAGPLLQWVGYDQEDDASDEESADGSGGGVYARAGFEFLLPSRKLVGLGVRASESSVDFDDDFGELDLSGVDVFISFSYGLQPRSKYAWD